MMGSQYFQCLTTSHSGWSFNHGDKVMWSSIFFNFIYLFFKKRWSESWEPFMIFKSQWFNRGSNGFVLSVHRTVLVVKRTVLVRGSLIPIKLYGPVRVWKPCKWNETNSEKKSYFYALGVLRSKDLSTCTNNSMTWIMTKTNGLFGLREREGE